MKCVDWLKLCIVHLGVKIYILVGSGKQEINAEGVGLSDLANKNARHSAKFEFQWAVNIFFIISMSKKIHGVYLC